MRNTDDYIIFFHLVEQGSFSAAARQMELTKSVVSKRIAKLEQEIGVQLLYRTTRTLKLTEAGQSFFEHARSVYQAVATAEESIVGLGKSLSGNIKITVPTISGELILPTVISEFNQAYPDINIDMELDNRFADIVNEGFDLAIRTGVLPDSSLIARKLADANWIVCASPRYVAKHGKPKRRTISLSTTAWFTPIKRQGLVSGLSSVMMRCIRLRWMGIYVPITHLRYATSLC